MSGLRRARFQEAAVEHILERLRDRKGSQRVLLADEVGLGKTIVARGVIEGLLAGRRRPLTVIYLCSSAEIAEQNRQKLDPAGGLSVGRITELAIGRKGSQAKLALYSFTPGTSLKGGTGLGWERRLLLYLAYRIFGKPLHPKRWRAFFRCGVREETWNRDASHRALRNQFRMKTSGALQAELARAWRDTIFEGRPLSDALRAAVGVFREGNPDAKAARNRLVSQLRLTMQKVVLRHLKPDLVVLDEVQRFRDVLEDAEKPENIANDLFSRGVPVLILSATPYRALTLGHEVSDPQASHHADFVRTLEFLFASDRSTPARIKERLATFGERLNATSLLDTPADELVSLKCALEEDLRKVICRTERNWYVLDHRKGVEEELAGRSALPHLAELTEYLHLYRALQSRVDTASQVTEFWKSAPSLLTFLDAQYALLRRIRDEQHRVPRVLLTAAGDVHDLSSRNHRLRCVVDHALGPQERLPMLWQAPTYKYYQDQFFGEKPPQKMLVFSGWRFVPKTIAIVASRVAENRFGGTPETAAQPLRFSDQRSFHVFDVCFPCPSLAAAVDFLPSASTESPERIRAEAIVTTAASRIRETLDRAGIAVVPSGGDPLWRVVMRLEQTAGEGSRIREGLQAWADAHTDEDTSFAVQQHHDWATDWLKDEKSRLQLNEAGLRRLALIVAFSPANSFLRALSCVYGEGAREAFPRLASFSLGALRRYFNRPHVQQILRQHEPRLAWPPTRAGTEHGYAERVLLYAADAHLQAVLDEYIYLLRHAAQSDTAVKAIEQLEAVLTLPRGTPRTNGARGSGGMVKLQPDAEVHATHFALAFGNDIVRDTGPEEEEGRLRKSVVREGFNSPFWPFVLATTSVGQEGLDFHLYCRDVLHWNLPSNPVDLEQREGRINRRDCLAIRQSIARDWPLTTEGLVNRDRKDNLWARVFAAVEEHEDPQRYKHGLYPHWVYECRNSDDTVRIRRHVPFFATSRDALKYERLKTGLALYRLVFGQANQEDLLARFEEKLEALDRPDRARVLRRLAGYMLNLSPISHKQAVRHAEQEAQGLLKAKNAEATIRRLLSDVELLRRDHPEALDAVADDLDHLVSVASTAIGPDRAESRDVLRALTALAYLRNPYDRIFDLHVEGGFADDIEVIRGACVSRGPSAVPPTRS